MKVVLPTVSYLNSSSSEKTCKAGKKTIRIDTVKTGTEASGKHTDTQIVFFVNGCKAVCHFYNTTQLIMVNGTGYKSLVYDFLAPFFEAKIDSVKSEIKLVNEQALQNLNGKSIKRGDMKFKTSLSKQNKKGQLLKRSFSSESSVNHPIHSTRNNSFTEQLCENVTITDITDDESCNIIENVPEVLKQSCGDCEYVANSNSDLDSHRKNKHPPAMVKNNSDQSSKKPENKVDLKYTCTVCKWNTKSKSHLNEHLTSKHAESVDDIRFVCAKCDHTFHIIEDYNEHLRKHDNNEKSEKLLMEEDMSTKSCSKCGVVMEDASSLNNHILSSHGALDIQPLVRNDISEAITLNKIVQHSVEHACNFCGSIVKDASLLKEHIITHHMTSTEKESDTVENPPSENIGNLSLEEASCSICKLVTKNITELTNHINSIHGGSLMLDGEGEENESDSSEDFNVPRNELDSHMLKMHGSMSICGECGKGFSDSHLCYQHMETEHAYLPDVAPFTCQECSASFHDSAALDLHTQQVHVTRKLPCNQCNFTSDSYSGLVKHKSTIHEGSLNADVDGYELFMNIVVAQQDLLLEKVYEIEKNMNSKFNILEEMRSCTCDSAQLAKFKEEITEIINEKLDILVRNLSSKPQSSSPAQSNKILLVGDDVSRNLNITVLKNMLDKDITRIETETESVIKNVMKNDSDSTLVLQLGTKEVTNLDTSMNIDSLKNEIRKSSEKIFHLAEKRLKENDGLKRVVIMKRVFRCDPTFDDPRQIKQKLSEFGNRVFEDLLLTRGYPDNIKLADQSVDCEGDLRNERFGSSSQPDFDGIHLNGNLGIQHYTGSMINALVCALKDELPLKPKKIHLDLPSIYQSVPRTFSTSASGN